MADSPTISRVEQALRRLDGLNTLAYEMNRLGRRAGLHDRVPWRERLERPPDNAIPLGHKLPVPNPRDRL